MDGGACFSWMSVSALRAETSSALPVYAVSNLPWLLPCLVSCITSVAKAKGTGFDGLNKEQFACLLAYMCPNPQNVNPSS